MSREIIFTPTAWNEYMDWQKADKKIAGKVNELIKAIQRSPFDGLGKPEPLKGNLSGYWSRHITDKHRIIYEVSNDKLRIIQVENHYDDK